MSRPPILINGTSYDLTHLEPFILTLEAKGDKPVRRVLVSFGCHTFTRDVKDGDGPEWLYREGTEERCFCADRHGYSQSLPRIVEYAAKGRVFFSEGRNLLCVDWLPGLDAPYAAFFNISKWKGSGLDAAITVVSAYGKDGLPDRLPSITFGMLVDQVISGRKPTPPKDLRSIRK